jgi:cardiolipin synthase
MLRVLHANPLYFVAPTFVGPEGPLTARRTQRLITRLNQHQEMPSDIHQRYLAFEQALTNVPLVLGNKVTLLENGTATYNAMLAAIRGAHDTILQMFIFSDGPVGQIFADPPTP